MNGINKMKNLIDRLLNFIEEDIRKQFWNQYEDLDTKEEFDSFLRYHDFMLMINPNGAKRAVKIREYLLLIKKEAEKITNEASRKMFEEINLESLYEWKYSPLKQWILQLV